MSEYYINSLVMSPPFSTGHLDAGATYPRIIQLNYQSTGGELLAICDQGQMINDAQVWPIFYSSDFGKTWIKLIDFQNDRSDYPLEMNPVIFEIPEGTNGYKPGSILLSGILKPIDISETLMPIYLSEDRGKTWRWLEDIDCGGPAEYDHEVDASTTAIWEPFFFVNQYGDLSICYSDERLKDDGILQALVLRYFDNKKKRWSDVVRMVALSDGYSRPGMISVTRLGNGKYVSTYEVVNKPSVENNYAEVYLSFSDDGLNWQYDDIGLRVETSDGIIPGSGPYITCAHFRNEEYLIISAKWQITKNGIQNSQDFFINKNDGKGFWERLPVPISYDSIGTQVENTAYSQSIISINNGIGQLVTVNNEDSLLNDLKYGYRKFPDSSITEFNTDLCEGVYSFVDNEATSNKVTELHKDGSLHVDLGSNRHISMIGLRYRRVSNPSTILVRYANSAKIIYLEKSARQFKWVYFEVGSKIDEIIIEDLSGSMLFEVERLDLYD